VIVAVRHAEVHNPDRVVYARLPGFHLFPRGRENAAALAGALERATVSAVFASPLDRAVETAAILAEPHGVAVQSDPRLLEWSFWAHWQGLPWARIRERDPDLLDAYARDPASAWPDDPLEEVGQRILGWAEEVDRSYPAQLVLGVTHEAPLIAAFLVGTGRGVGAFHSMNLPHLATVRLRPGPPEVVDLATWARSC
jgi:broad specificity phosphatase PhoE